MRGKSIQFCILQGIFKFMMWKRRLECYSLKNLAPCVGLLHVI